MLYKSLASTSDELAHRVYEANRECRVAKQALDSLVQAVQAWPGGIVETEGVPILDKLTARERSARLELAEALQVLYDHTERLYEHALPSTMCA